MNIFIEERLVLTIGKLALRVDVTTDTVRYYEKEGRIADAGRKNRRRLSLIR